MKTTYEREKCVIKPITECHFNQRSLGYNKRCTGVNKPGGPQDWAINQHLDCHAWNGPWEAPFGRLRDLSALCLSGLLHQERSWGRQLQVQPSGTKAQSFLGSCCCLVLAPRWKELESDVRRGWCSITITVTVTITITIIFSSSSSSNCRSTLSTQEEQAAPLLLPLCCRWEGESFPLSQSFLPAPQTHPEAHLYVWTSWHLRSSNHRQSCLFPCNSSWCHSCSFSSLWNVQF